MRVERVHEHFVALATDIDLGEELSEDQREGIASSIGIHGVLVFPDQQSLDDDGLIRFSSTFGELQRSITVHRDSTERRLKRPELSDISNVGLLGERLDRQDERRLLQRPAGLWHSDSSFRSPPGLYTFLIGRVIPPEGGDTQFADMRLAYDALDQRMKDRIGDLSVRHSLGRSRLLSDAPPLSESERSNIPESLQPLVRVHPQTGRHSLYLSSHADKVIGLSDSQGRTLLDELTGHATQEDFIYTHRWTQGDLVMWDNRSTMHRVMPFQEHLYRRDMRRTTIADTVAAKAATAGVKG